MSRPAAALGSAEGGASSPVVSMSDVRFAWGGPRAFALDVGEFTLGRRERLLLLGPSGAGKSTFLSLIAGILAPASGRLEVLGTDMGRLGGSARDRFRAEHLGIIFQMFNLLPYGSILDNVVLPLSFARERRRRVGNRAAVEREALRLLASLGLDIGELAGLKAASLSVGQQQRVAAARALIGRPELIIADEPTSALDRTHQLAFLDLLFAEVEAAGASLIVVSHDETLGHRFDRLLRLDAIATAERRSAA